MTADGDGTNATPRQMFGHVLRPDELLSRARYGAAEPAPALAPWIERYWSVRWDLGPGECFPVATLDDPSVNLTLERGGVRREGTDGAGTWIPGPVARGRFGVGLAGRGSVVGVKIRVGAVLGLVPCPAPDLRALRDRTVPAAAWFTDPPFPASLPEDAEQAAPLLDAWLLSLHPRADEEQRLVRSVLQELEGPEVTSLVELERRTGLGARTLQRLFARTVGVPPKRMLLRARVMDAIAAIDREDPRPHAEIAADLGWFDQSHFIRDVRAITGTTPAAYAQRAAARRSALR